VKLGDWEVFTEVGKFFADTISYHPDTDYFELSRDQFHIMLPGGFYHRAKLSV
jgi:hypothetical protein